VAGVCGAGRPVEASKPESQANKIAVAIGKPGSIRDGPLTVELLGVKDNRCAAEVKCVWAGYAELTLRVSKAGADAATVAVGTLPPGQNEAPRKGTYGPYRLSLDALEPPNSIAKPVEQSAYRATLSVTKE
jgi:hypothetical protein